MDVAFICWIVGLAAILYLSHSKAEWVEDYRFEVFRKMVRFGYFF